ncbi:MAG: flagellin [Planctomycetota bacterium]
MTVGRINSTPAASAANAFNRFNDATARSTTSLATGQRINRAADDPSGLISSENLRAVLASLEAEADTLRRADAVANTAEGALATASDLLIDNAGLEVRLANTAGLAPGEAEALRIQFAANQQAATRITGNAAFAGVPLFDGNFSLQVGGGRLELPDLVTSAPTQQALATLRGEIGAFQTNIVGSRLQIVEATILSTAQTQSMIRDTDFAQATAELVRNETLTQASLQAAVASNRQLGSLLDVLG